MYKKIKYNQKVLKYKGRIVFQKLSFPFIDRLPKEYIENEACFVFVQKGAFSVRSQTKYLELNKEIGFLAKCLNFFYETSDKHKLKDDHIEVIGILLYPSLIIDLFDFDVLSSNYSVPYNIKPVQIDSLLENYKNSINILLDNSELVDEVLVETKLKEFILLISKTENAPSHLDFLAALFKPNSLEFKKTILQNLYSSLSIDQLASLCNMSRSTFKRRFKEVFDENPRVYINRKKIEKV